jgi:glycosyltransferase involved in cell wall biosynthesis
MDICLLIGGLRGGGTERVCVTLANALATRGHNVELVVLDLRGDVRSAELSPLVRLVNLDAHHARNAFLPLLCYLKKSEQRLVLSFNHQLTALLVAMRPLVRDLKIVDRSPNFASASQGSKVGVWHRVIVDWVLRKVVRGADWHVAQSHDMAAEVVRYFGIAADRITVVRNPLSPSFNLVTNRSVPRASTILCVGRLVHQKGWSLALAAFVRFRQRHRDSLLQFVGSGPLEPEMRAEAERLGIADAVSFEGFQKNLRPFYESARVTLLTSHFEGFPNVLLEALACGCPVVAVDCPTGPSELIVDGLNGLLVPSRDPEAVAERLALVFASQWEVSAMRATIDDYHPDAVASHYEQLFEGLRDRAPVLEREGVS